MTVQVTQPPSVAERLTEQFYRFEKRGRGWQLWDVPVDLEPPFAPFVGHYLDRGLPDDGRQQTGLSSLFGSIKSWITGSTSPLHVPPVAEQEPLAKEAREGGERVSFRIVLPAKFDAPCRTFEAFLLALSSCRHPISFELIGDARRVQMVISADEMDAPQVEDQLAAHFPDAILNRADDVLEGAWQEARGESLVVDFGLSREFMVPIATHKEIKTDPFVGIIAALSRLGEGELAVFQVLFSPVKRPWSQSILRAVTFPDGSPFFDDAPEFFKQAEQKVSRPLFAGVIRMAAVGADDERMWEIGRRLTAALAPFSAPEANEFIPLANDEYDDEDHVQDLLHRRSRRQGMLLNSEELASVVHLPAGEVQSAKLDRIIHKTKAAPETAIGHALILGTNVHNGRSLQVSLSPDQRVRHMHVIGSSGTGKSTFFLNCIMQDIERGEGVGVIDPHGDLIDQIIARIPEHRQKDVVLVDPSDEGFPIGFNILSAHSDLEKTLLASDLVGIFRRFSTSWGDQMGSVLGNAVLALLESSRGGTLADLRRFLIEPPYRNEFLATVGDPHVAYYWKKEFPLLTGRPQAPLLTRLDAFLRPKTVRYMVAQQHNRLDFSQIMDTKKIFLAKLAQGAIGEENAFLLGALFVAKFHQLTLGRQAVAESGRKYFWLYCDEFGGYVTPSMARLLSGARKYRLGLVLSHQELQQLHDKEVASALLSNAGTRLCFKVGDSDSKALGEGFALFEASDLRNLSTGEAICRVGKADDDFNLTTSMMAHVDEELATRRRSAVVEFTRATYATSRSDVEKLLARDDEHDLPKKVGAATPISMPQEVVEDHPPATTPVQKTPGANSDPELGIQEASVTVKPPKAAKSMRSGTKPLGKGGDAHKYWQHLLAQWGQGMGYKATVEMPTPDGGSVDVVLETEGRRIACEISVTTTADQEMSNLRKCLAAGFDDVYMACVDAKTLKALKKAAEVELSQSALKTVRFLHPEEMMASPDLMPGSGPPEQTVCGYKVKINLRSLNVAESTARKQIVSKILATRVQ